MKPAPFDYYDPDNLEKALELLHEYGDEAKILAGGQSLGPLLNMRLSTPRILIDINRLPELQYLNYNKNLLTIGAMTRQSTLEDDSQIKHMQPLLASSIPYIGHRSIRNRGTVGGSIAHADPAAEWPAIMLALDGKLEIKNATESRLLTAEEFYISTLTTALEPTELLTEVQLPLWEKNTGWSFIEFSRRHGDFAVIGVATSLKIQHNLCNHCRIAIIGGSSIPMRTKNAESVVTGKDINSLTFKEAGEIASLEVNPETDMHASAAFRRHLTSTLVTKSLHEAYNRITTEGDQ